MDVLKTARWEGIFWPSDPSLCMIAQGLLVLMQAVYLMLSETLFIFKTQKN